MCNYTTKSIIKQIVLKKYSCKTEKVCYNALHWRRSSVVEQRNHNPLVRGPNPFAATKNSTPIYSGFNFLYLGFGDRQWGPTRNKKAE